MQNIIWRLAATVILVTLAACGGGGSSGSPAPTTPPPAAQSSAQDTARFLDQATFGVTATDVAHVQSVGFNAYLVEQLAAPISQYTGFSYTPHTAPTTCQYHAATPTDASSICSRDQYSLFQVQRQFFMHALSDSDQLRQRVAFALSQIFVTSGIEIYEAYGMADYQNMLLKDAFGNFRDLLQDVIDHHAAGRRTEAAAAYARVLPLINYENRQCGLRAAKIAMAEGGVIKSGAVRHPLDPIHPGRRHLF